MFDLLIARVSLAQGIEAPRLADLDRRRQSAIVAGDARAATFLGDALGIRQYLRGDLAGARVLLEAALADYTGGAVATGAQVAGALLGVLDAQNDIVAMESVERAPRAIAPPTSPALAAAFIARAALHARARSWAEAEDQLRQGIALVVASSGVVSLPILFEELARARFELGAGIEAARLLGVAHAVREHQGQYQRSAPFAARHASTHQAVSESLGLEFERIYRDAAAFLPAEAAEFVQRMPRPHDRPRLGWAALTPTEEHVAELASDGLTNAEIGTRLLMGSETVKSHLSHAFTKLGIRRRSELSKAQASTQARPNKPKEEH